MPIICEDFDGNTDKFSYRNNKKFVLAYPKPNPLSPLGSEWKFEPCFLPSLQYKGLADQLENIKIRADDVFSITCPKSGSTWSQEMIWLLCNNLNYAEALAKDTFSRVPYVGCDSLMNVDQIKKMRTFDNMNSPRVVKCHLPAGLLPKEIWSVKPKIIYTARSIRDAAISFYHHYVNIYQYKGSMEDFLDSFLNNRIVYTPNHCHIRDFWFMRDEENILFITYEEMKQDLISVLKRVSNFLGKTYSDDELRILEKHLSFDSMKANNSVNWQGIVTQLNRELCSQEAQAENVPRSKFIRKGIVGSHKEEMPLDYIERFDKMTEEFNRLNGTCITP